MKNPTLLLSLIKNNQKSRSSILLKLRTISYILLVHTISVKKLSCKIGQGKGHVIMTAKYITQYVMQYHKSLYVRT